MTFNVVSSSQKVTQCVTNERRIKVYRSYDNVFGLPPRIYRTPDEIRLDIYEVRQEIEKINSRLNIRGLMLEIISEEAKLSPKDVVSTLETMLAEAEEALSELNGLKEELLDLEKELKEVKCAMRT